MSKFRLKGLAISRLYPGISGAGIDSNFRCPIDNLRRISSGLNVIQIDLESLILIKATSKD